MWGDEGWMGRRLEMEGKNRSDIYGANGGSDGMGGEMGGGRLFFLPSCHVR